MTLATVRTQRGQVSLPNVVLSTVLIAVFLLGMLVSDVSRAWRPAWLGGSGDAAPLPAVHQDSTSHDVAATDTPVVAARPENETPTVMEGPDLRWQNELEFLREEVDAAREDRELLADRVAELETELASLSTALTADLQRGGQTDPGASTAGTGSSLAEFAVEDLPDDPVHNRAAARFGAPTRDREESLVAAGVDPQRAADIQQRADQNQLARLELIDRATREGWLESDQFQEQLETIDAGGVDLREELGDADYDQYLYEAGRNNRVAIASVIGGSAADIAGVLPGDVVLSYANVRVFNMRELQQATREGNRGEYVQLTLSRDDSVVAVELPRGPLGVTLSGQRTAP